MQESQLKRYSLGIVIEDKERDADLIKVTPMEVLPLQSGALNDQVRDYSVDVPDASGVKRSSKLQGSNFIVAKWLAGDATNRITPPDVRQGETVQLYRYADTTDYYWRTLFREPSLRKLETANFAFGNIQGPGEISKENSYYAEVSTHDKHVIIQTSQSDGEAYGYTIKIDASAGKILIEDTVQNSIVLDSASNSIDITSNTTITVKSQQVNVVAPNVTIDSGSVGIKGIVTVDGSIQASGPVHGSNI